MSSSLRLAFCSYQAALYACTHWHYSGTIPRGKCVYIGVWEDERYIGAVILTLGAGRATDGRRFGLPQFFAVSELQRIALTRHRAPVSRILRVAVSLLRKQSPGLRLLMSYADPLEGHHGGIYQAAGWVYVGTSAKTLMYRAPDGRAYHSRVISPKGYTLHYGIRQPNPVPFEELVRFYAPGKHTYLLPIDPGIRPRIEVMAQPYPKRPKHSADALPPPGERGRFDSDPDAPAIPTQEDA